jgi:hypothetical protein
MTTSKVCLESILEYTQEWDFIYPDLGENSPEYKALHFKSHRVPGIKQVPGSGDDGFWLWE